MTPAPAPARTFFHVHFRGKATQLKRLADKLMHAFLHLVHFFLRINKSFGDGIAKQTVALRFKRRDLLRIQLKALMLLIVQRAALFRQALILLLCLRVRHKGIDPLPDALKLGLLNDGLAKFNGFLSRPASSIRVVVCMAVNMRPISDFRKRIVELRIAGILKEAYPFSQDACSQNSAVTGFAV